jgi:hypothetical protein
MAKVAIVKKRARIEKSLLLTLHISTECLLRGIHVTKSELECLVLLSFENESSLATFCHNVVGKGIFSNPQTVRNFLAKSEKQGIVEKIQVPMSNKKNVSINKSFTFTQEDNILLDYKFSYVSKENR